MNAGDRSAWSQREIEHEAASRYLEKQRGNPTPPQIPFSLESFTSPIKVELANNGDENVVRLRVHPVYARTIEALPDLDFDHVMADRLADQIKAAARAARGEVE